MKVISASEIGEFYYCCVAWWLKNKGIKRKKPEQIKKEISVTKDKKQRAKLEKQLVISKTITKNLEKGIKRHTEIGEKITQVEQEEVTIHYLEYIGYGALALAVFAIIYLVLT